MTTLGSNLQIDNQTLRVIGIDYLQISEHTTGDSLENGQYELDLQDDYFEIYLEVPERQSSQNIGRIW